MAEKPEGSDTDLTSQILRALQEDARVPMTALGRRVGLSSPAVTERVHRLEDAGVVRGYHADVDPARMGFALLVFIRMSAPIEKSFHIAALAKRRPEVLECHRVTGEDNYVLKAAVASVAHLEGLIDELSLYGNPKTSLVLSSPVTRKTLDPATVKNNVES